MIAEPYREDDGEIGFAVIWEPDTENTAVEIKPLSQWSKDSNSFSKELKKHVEDIIWDLPSHPDLEYEDRNLKRDIVRYIADHVWFRDDGFYSHLTDWCICTWIPEVLKHFPRIIFFAPTRSGKTRALKTLSMLSYRGFFNSLPTGPALFRLFQNYRCSVFIDEFQSIPKEKMSDVKAIYKDGYDRSGKTVRCHQDDPNKCHIYSVFGPIAIATKVSPDEDLQNRSILIQMLEKSRNENISRRIDEEAASEIRTRLLAFRLKVLSQRIDLSEVVNNAWKIAETSIQMDNGKILELSDRSIEIASQLLIPGILFKDYDDTLRLIADSERLADEAARDMQQVEIISALKRLVEEKQRSSGLLQEKADISEIGATISGRDVSDEVNAQRKRDDPDLINILATNRIHKLLRDMGFNFSDKKTDNRRWFDPKGFKQTYETLVRKFGL